MVAMPRYHEVRSPQAWDPLAAATGLSRGAPFRDFVLYEKDGVWYYAGGTAAQLWVSPREIITSWPGKRNRVGWENNPLPAVSRLLADYPGGRWNAYGWVTFELSYYLHGQPAAEPELPLVRLIIPHTEAVIAAGGAVIRSLSRRTARECMELMEATGDDLVPAAEQVPIRTGRAANTPARSFLLRLDDTEAAGFSPETVVVTSREGRVTTQPLAGTRAFGRGAETDRALSAELRADPKEVYEHAISMRSSWVELASVCMRGSVHVDEPMALKFRGTVQHLGSLVSGRLAAGRSPLDALAAVFPAVTASGIPKAAACACISRIEPVARGLYAGSVFRLGSDRALDAALVLRSVYQSAGDAWLQAGAGIVSMSRPEREFEETCEKLACVASHIVPARAARADDAPVSFAAAGAVPADAERQLAPAGERLRER